MAPPADRREPPKLDLAKAKQDRSDIAEHRRTISSRPDAPRASDPEGERGIAGAGNSDAPGARPQLGKRELWVAGLVLVCIAIPIYLALKSYGFREAGVGAFVATCFGLLAFVGAIARLLFARATPRALALAAVAAGLGSAGLLIAAISAHSMHSDADLVRHSDVVLEPGMREYLVGEAQRNGRRAALYGLLAVPGAILGMLTLVLVLGTRRIAETSARIKGEKSEPVTPVWIAISVCSAAFVIGFVLDVWAMARKVEDHPNPREERLVAVRDAVDAGRWNRGCEELEVVLERDYVPRRLLEEKLPDHVELAHRCIGFRIDELPSGKSCESAAEKLLELDIVRVANAKDRVRSACKGR